MAVLRRTTRNEYGRTVPEFRVADEPDEYKAKSE